MFPKQSVSRRRLSNGLFRRFTLRHRLVTRFLICCVLWTTLESLYIYHRDTTVDSLEPHPLHQGQHERIFIVSTHWNNEPILRSHWNKCGPSTRPDVLPFSPCPRYLYGVAGMAWWPCQQSPLHRVPPCASARFQIR